VKKHTFLDVEAQHFIAIVVWDFSYNRTNLAINTDKIIQNTNYSLVI